MNDKIAINFHHYHLIAVNPLKMFRLIGLILVFGFVHGYHRHHAGDQLSKEEYYRQNELHNGKSVEDQEDKNFWYSYAKDELDHAVMASSKFNTKVAKNIIIFVGDGMSNPTLTAARIYKAQRENNNYVTPERDYLFFERLDHMGHSKTFDTDYQTPDSASTASAMFCGVKTKYHTMGYDSHISEFDPQSGSNDTNKVTSFMTWAQEAGKDTGIVTTARITHATPAATYAHSFARDFECDTWYDEVSLGPLPDNVHDIAYQLVNDEPGNKFKVILGGGYSAFIQPEDRPDPNTPVEDLWDCFRNDTNLMQQWQMDHEIMGNTEVVWNVDELKAVDTNNTDYLMGLMNDYHIVYDNERVERPDQPSLTEMVEVAIPMLMKGDNGFALMVEGARIDHSHHDTSAVRALSETVSMDHAVERAMELLGDEVDDTLIIVTADHAHTMTISGYQPRGNDIGGLTGRNLDDDLPYTTLSYANGEAYFQHNIVESGKVTRNRSALEDEDTSDFYYHQTNSGLKNSETHGGDDVSIFSTGPMSHLFHTTHDQTHIAHVMAYAACIGPYKDDPNRCPLSALSTSTSASSASASASSSSSSSSTTKITTTTATSTNPHGSSSTSDMCNCKSRSGIFLAPSSSFIFSLTLGIIFYVRK